MTTRHRTRILTSSFIRAGQKCLYARRAKSPGARRTSGVRRSDWGTSATKQIGFSDPLTITKKRGAMMAPLRQSPAYYLYIDLILPQVVPSVAVGPLRSK